MCLQGAPPDVGNRGSRALSFSLMQLVIDSKPEAKIHLLYRNRTHGIQNFNILGKTIEVEIVNCRLSPKSRINEHLLWIFLLALIHKIVPIKSVRDKIVRSNHWLSTLHDADFVGEILGGDSLSDIYGRCRFLFQFLPSVIATLMNKDLVLLPQTYGPFKSIVSRAVARFVMRRSKRIFSRDKPSMELVRELLDGRDQDKSLQLCPDVAFNLGPIEPAQVDIQPPLDQNSNVPLIGLNVSGLLYVGGYTRNNMFGLTFDYEEFVHLLIKELMERTEAHLLLVPHVFWGPVEGDELAICRELLKSLDPKCADRVHLVMQEYDQSQTKWIIGLCDFFIGARMHACIAALSQGIPTVGLAYSRKFYGVFQTVGAEQYVADMRSLGRDEVIETIARTYQQRETIRETLQPSIAEAKQRVTNIFREMLGREKPIYAECTQ